MKTLQELRSCGSKKEETTPVKGKGKKKVEVTTDSKIKTDSSNNTETSVSEVRSADKKPEKYVDQNGKTRIRMVPVVREQEEIDELNKSTLQSYKAQATGQAMSRSFAAQDAKDSNKADTHVKKEETVDVAEASFTAAASMNAANRKQSGGKAAQPDHGFRVGGQVTTKDGKEGQVTFVHGDTVHVKGTNNYYPDRIKHYSAKDLKHGVSEGVESLLEYPSDLAKMKKVDSYNVGDKIWTKVGGKWLSGKITTPLNKAGNYGVKFKVGNKTLDSYATKAKADYQKASDSGDYGRAFKRSLGNMKAQGKKIANTTKDIRKTLNREAVQEPTGKLKDACWKGYTAVGMKMKNGKKVPNCVPKEGVNEKLGKDADAGDYIRDFEKSDAPQFKGKSKEKKRQMAIAAYYGSKKEETMQRFATFIDEKKGHFRSVEQGAGMTKKGVEAFRRENPGSKLQTAVTKKPSEMDPDSKDAKRRKSFCARSKGWTGERGKAARKRWNC